MAPTPVYRITMATPKDLHVNVHVTGHVNQQGAAAIINESHVIHVMMFLMQGRY